MFGQLGKVVVGEAEAGPVDVKPAQHGVGELQGDVGRHRFGMGVGIAGSQQQTDVLVGGQPFQRGRDALRDRFRRVGDAVQVFGQPVEKSRRRVHGGGEQQRVGAGEVPVDGLPGDTQRCAPRRRC